MEQTKKIIIYQVFPRWFDNRNSKPVKNGSIKENGVGKFSAFTAKALNEIKTLGITHVWYTGVIEHATKTDYTLQNIARDHSAVVKGNAGSPYAIKDYYDVDPDLAEHPVKRMKEFESLVKRTHTAGLKMLIDFVPNHVARQYHSDVHPQFVEDLGQKDDHLQAFAPNNNFYYIPGQPLSLPFGALQEDFLYSEFPAKATGNDRFDAFPDRNDWYETVKLNYGVDYVQGGTKHFDPIPDTWVKMYEILQFWAEKGVDGFRCDMAEMVPVEFWHWVIPKIKHEFDGIIFIAEVYNPAQYRNYIQTGHFDYLYDKVGLYDTLRNVMCAREPASAITGCWQAVNDIQHQMLNFLENHDEQRIASEFFAGNPLPGIPGLLVSALMNTNPVMIYSGQELGEPGMDEEGFSGRDGRTTIFDYWSLETLRNWIDGGTYKGSKLKPEQHKLREMYSKILIIAQKEPAVVRGDFFDLMYANQHNPAFNTQKVFAFLRKYKEEVLLVVANFDGNEQTLQIRIPDEAFAYFKLKDNKAASVIDLLTGAKNLGTLTSAYPYEVKVAGYAGTIVKFDYSDKR